MITEWNKTAYNTKKAAEVFDHDTDLQAPEKEIFKLLQPDMRVLDIGIGTGRTTRHIHVREYVGIDYSEAMINKAKQNFPDADLRLCDARALPFPDNSFDFVLFSFNGIDVVDPEDRIKILSEMRRVSRAYVCFSSHNLLCIRKFFTVQLNRNLQRMWGSAKRAWRTIFANGVYSQYVRSLRDDEAQKQAILDLAAAGRDLAGLAQEPLHWKSYGILNEDNHFLKLQHYYISPIAQKKQLASLGLDLCAMLGLDGREASVDCRDTWIYYLAKRK